MSRHRISKFGNMVDIFLNCRLFRDVEENCTFTIFVNTAKSVENFKKDIKEKIKRTGNDIFDGIEADHLILWQVWISNSDEDKFSTLTLETKNNVKKLEGFIGDYWTKKPLKEFTHVIVDSPYLTVLRKLNSLTMSSQDLNPINISLEQLYNEQYIKQGNVLLYNRTYKNVKFTRKFKIKDIYNTRKLLVILTSADNEETLMLFGSLSELELYIINCFNDTTRVTGSAYDRFFIIDEGVNKGSITELRRQYVKHKTREKEEAENQKKQPDKLGERKIRPLLDPNKLKSLNHIKDKFLMKFEKEIPFSCVVEGLVDGKEVIVAFVDQPEEMPVHLPAEFEGIPVLISYEALVLYYRKFHKDLTPGISIGSLGEPLNAGTLGPLFQITAEPDKTFILTAKHAVGKEGEDVVQPGTLDEVTKYNFIGADSDCNYIDYAFCEAVKDREIPKIPNVPLGQRIQIRSIKTSIDGNNNFVEVQKVGRTTGFTRGLIQDKLVPFFPPIVKKKNKKRPKERRKRYALQVFGIEEESTEIQPFSELGDSGAPVFDDNGKLWGICIAGISGQVSYVVPIHLILGDVKNKFNSAVFSLKKETEELEES